MEIIKYNKKDIKNYIYKKGCFGNIDGKEYIVLQDFDRTKPIGKAILRDTEESIIADIVINNNCCLTSGFIINKSKVEGNTKIIEEADLLEISIIDKMLGT